MLFLVQTIVALNGPWAFHIGDDPRWADPAFDDSQWEAVDLTPRPGAHDPDVGLPGYVPGWTARGHAGYSGVAWYRMHITLDNASNDTLAFSGSPAVDDGYEVFVNGVRVGQAGAPYSIRPHYFVLPPIHSATIAIRVRAGLPGDDGGMHIAPAIGSISAVRDRYTAQWGRTLWGYVVDGLEPVAFVCLAILALALRQPWMGLALVLSAILRVNQVTFFWGQFETLGFYLVLPRIIRPLILGAWLMAWRAWFGVRLPPALIVVVVALVWVWPWARWGCAALMLAIIVAGMRQSGGRQWLGALAAILISIGLFAPELSALHIPGIWFPFGVGVSRTQYAYAAFDVVLLVLFAWTISNSLPATSPSTS